MKTVFLTIGFFFIYDDLVAQEVKLEDLIRFGAEWTFSNDKLFKSFPKVTGWVESTETGRSKKYVKQVAKQLKSEQESRPKSEKLMFTEKDFHSNWDRLAYTATYPDGYNFTFFTDPGALEVNTAPSTLNQIRKYSNRLQRDVFDVMKSQGLAPALFTASGHIHIEAEKLDALTLRNFLVDFYNHTGLCAGAFNEDVYNALGSGEFPDAQKEVFRKELEKFDKNPNSTKSNLVNSLDKKVYKISLENDLPEYQKHRSLDRPNKYFGVSFDSFKLLGTIEIRCLRPQGSVKSYEKLLTLFVERIRYAQKLAKKGIRIPLNELKSLRGKPQEVLADFDDYVTGVGLHFEDYREFVLPWWQNKGADFDQYLKQSKSSNCKNVRKKIKITSNSR